MLNFDKNMACEKAKETFDKLYNKTKNLKKKTKEIICVSAVGFLIASFVLYDLAAGVAYASGSMSGTPHVIKAGGQEVVVVQSKADAETAMENVKLAYGKLNMETTAIITPAITIEEKEYVTGEDVKILDSNEATRQIIEKNASETPMFEVYVEQPSIRTEAIPFETVEIETDDMDKGEREVRTEGKPGVKLLTTKEVLVNGKLQSSQVYTATVKTLPEKEVVVVGVREPKVEEPATESKSTAQTSSSSRKASSSKASNVSYSYNSAKSGGVLGYAKSFHGVPYVYGGSTPSGFDCSGFTSYVYRAFGVNLPHSSAAQSSYGVPVSRSEAKPGDLVVMPGHVGIYAGGGLITHAPYPGKSVTTQPLWTNATFRRLV